MMNFTGLLIRSRLLPPVGLLFLFLLLSTSVVHGIEIIKEPKPTHVETHFRKLVKVKEIPLDLSDTIFMAKAEYMTVDESGHLFVYDGIIKKIFKFDKDGSFLFAFGNKGNGPAEFGSDNSNDPIHFSKAGYLYAGERQNNKIIKFDSKGCYIEDIKLPYRPKADGVLKACVDGNENYFVLSGKSNGIDVFNKELKYQYSLLGKKEYDSTLIRHIGHNFATVMTWTIPDALNTYYDCIPGNQLVVYLANTSTVYIYEKSKLVRKFQVLPKLRLEIHLKAIEKRFKNLRRDELLIMYMFYDFFIDKDNHRFIYLRGGKKDGSFLTYQFDLKGNLVKVLCAPRLIRFKAKKSGLFYGIRDGNIHIYKEEVFNEKKEF